jgi:hypothetical protein
LSTNVQGRRVSILSAADMSQHPMRGVELVNTSGGQMMPGPISVFDGGTYAGDAQIGHVPAGDKRLLAYSVDLEVAVTRENANEGRVRKVRIVKGLTEITQLNRSKVTYTIENKDQKRARTIIVEHPKLEGWKLAEPAAATEVTESLYRFEVALDATKVGKLVVTQERTDVSSIGVMDMNLGTILEYSKQGEVSSKVIDAFREVAKRREAIGETSRKIEELRQERATIDQDQTRIRSNVGATDRQSQLYSRYMQKLTEQESRLEAIDAEVKKLQEQMDKQQDELNTFVLELNID